MSFLHAPALSRRQLLQAGAALSLAAALPRQARAAEPFTLTAAPARAALLGEGAPLTAVWAYNGSVPGPTLRLVQGEPFRLRFTNRLKAPSTIHWHGMRVPNAMDGVPDLTQKAVAPGESFDYAFTPPDAGTFWYHPHADSLRQLGRGLAGAVIVAEKEPIAVDRDLLWVIGDFRLDESGAITGGFGNRMEAAMDGRIGNTVTINGRVRDKVSVRAGERIRLRLVNTALARVMALRFEGHAPQLIALDGQPLDKPRALEGEPLHLGPGMRADLVLDMQGEPGKAYAVRDEFYAPALTYRLTRLVYSDEKPLRAHPPDAPVALPRNPLPEPDLKGAVRHTITLEGGMMGMMSGGGMGGMMGRGGMMGGMMGGMGGGMMGMMDGAVWAMNGAAMTEVTHDMAPLFSLKRGQSCVVTLKNDTAFWHPMHLHGFSFRVLGADGKPGPWQDTVLLAPREAKAIAFVADRPGPWMLHCHVLDHQEAGMMAVIRIA